MTEALPRAAAPPVARALRRRRATAGRRQDGPWIGRAGPLAYVFLGAVVAVSLFPLYWMFVVASNSNAVMAQLPPRVTPGPNLLANAERVLAALPFARALLNSFVVAGTVTASVLFFSTLAGFAFAKLRFRGREALFAFVLVTMMVPQQLGLIPLYMLMARFGWVNQLRAAIVPMMVTAFGVFWMRQYISGALHDELLEAGRVDGCSTFGLFRHIVVPAVRPAAGVLGLITFATAWNDFLWPLVVLQGQEKHTVQIALQQLNNAYIQDYSLVMAGTLMAIAPLLAMFLLFSRQMVSGVMEGSVKA
jgi:cellobiose transport system permease protein